MNISCKICGGSRLAPLYRIKNFDIMRCADCGFGQVDVSLSEVRSYYDKAYYDGERANYSQQEDGDHPALKYWLDSLLPARASGLNVLEIGPGIAGWTPRYLSEVRPGAKIGYEAIEISPYGVERLRSKEITVHHGGPADPAIVDACRGRFEVVIGTEVIEHDPDPRQFARAIHAVLKPGGACHFTTGNLDGWMARVKKARWYYFDPPAHVSYFTPKSAKHLFLESGFDKVGTWCIGFEYINLKLKTKVPGILTLTHLLQLGTGMTISAHKGGASG